MVKKIIGLDETGKKVFERDARIYEQNIANRTFGITISDIFKVVPVLVLIVTVYVNQQNFNSRVIDMVSQNTQSIGKLTDVIANINSSLSAITGKQYRDGYPTGGI